MKGQTMSNSVLLITDDFPEPFGPRWRTTYWSSRSTFDSYSTIILYSLTVNGSNLLLYQNWDPGPTLLSPSMNFSEKMYESSMISAIASDVNDFTIRTHAHF